MPDPTTTTVYVPTLIETAEQAEQLPIGTVATFPGQALAAVRSDYDTGGWLITTDCDPNVSHEDMIGATALVPVTATVERRSVQENDNGSQSYFNPEAVKNPGWVGKHIATMPVEARYTTPWTPEEAT